MFDQFSQSASQAMCLADEEAERLRHDYLGPEHVLVGLASQDGSRAAAVLAAAGAGPEILRACLDRLVAQGLLPAPWRNKADLLRSLGIDLDAVRRAAEDSFGLEALSAASCRARRRSLLRDAPIMSVGPLNPLSGKALLAKRAFALAILEAGNLGQHEVGPEHLLLGILADAEQPLGTGLSRRTKRMCSHLGLAAGGPSPVRLAVEGAGLSIGFLRSRVLADLRPVT